MAATPYSIRLDDDLRKALEREAEIEDRPAAQLAARAIRSMLEAKAAKRDALTAALQRAEEGRFIPAEAVNDWLASWDSAEERAAPQPTPQPPAR